MKPLQRHPHITDSDLERLEILVPKELVGSLQKTCRFEVLGFHTAVEYEMTNTEPEAKKRIRAKFRDYDHAEKYAQELLVPGNCNYFHKVILRA